MCPECERDRDAGSRARDVLLSALTPAQAQQFQQFGWFEVHTRNGHVYRLHRGASFNVVQMDGDRPLCHFCAVPLDNMPLEYMLLAQLLMLNTDELRFLRTANRNVPFPYPTQNVVY